MRKKIIYFYLLFSSASFFLSGCFSPDNGTNYPYIEIISPDVESGGSYNFGNTAVGSTRDAVLTIKNISLQDLNLTGNASPVKLDTATDFSVYSSLPSSIIVAGSSANFILRFAPASSGLKTAEVTISSKDSDGNPFTFTVNGTGIEVSMTKTFPYVEGSLTLDPGLNSPNVKIGLFFRSGTEGTSNTKLEFDGLKGRIYYLNNDNAGTAYKFTPSVLGNISSDGTYFINMPDVSTLANGGLYYLAAWNDADNDLQLKLVAEGTQSDNTLPTNILHATEGEYNRVPVINVLVSGVPKDAYVGFFDKLAAASGPTYEFKYYGVNPFFKNEPITELKNTNTTNNANTNFNFTISNTVDTN